MLIQVTTTHGEPFWCADIRFGPRPMRLWLGEDKPPDANLPRITNEQLARMEALTGDDGPLFIEKNPAFAGSQNALFADYTEALEQLDQTERRVVALDDENERLRGHLAAIEAQLSEQREALAATEKRAADLVENNEKLRGQIAGFESLLAEEREKTAAAEKRVADLERKKRRRQG